MDTKFEMVEYDPSWLSSTFHHDLATAAAQAIQDNEPVEWPFSWDSSGVYPPYEPGGLQPNRPLANPHETSGKPTLCEQMNREYWEHFNATT